MKMYYIELYELFYFIRLVAIRRIMMAMMADELGSI